MAPTVPLIQSTAAKGYFDELRVVNGPGAPAALPGATNFSIPAPGQTQPHPHYQQANGHAARAPVGYNNNAVAKKKGSANSVQLNKQIMACSSVNELLSLVKDSGSQFDGFNISSALARVPKLLQASPSSGGLIPAEGRDANGDSLRLDNNGRALMDCLGDMMCRHINKFDARGLANAAWAIGKTKYTPTPALPALIASAAFRQLDTFNPQNLSNLMWSQVGHWHM